MLHSNGSNDPLNGENVTWPKSGRVRGAQNEGRQRVKPRQTPTKRRFGGVFRARRRRGRQKAFNRSNDRSNGVRTPVERRFGRQRRKGPIFHWTDNWTDNWTDRFSDGINRKMPMDGQLDGQNVAKNGVEIEGVAFARGRFWQSRTATEPLMTRGRHFAPIYNNLISCRLWRPKGRSAAKKRV